MVAARVNLISELPVFLLFLCFKVPGPFWCRILQKNEILDQYDDFNDFTKSYHLDGKRKKDFFSWLETQTVEFVAEELDEHWNYIQNRILSNIASSIWGKEFFYKKLLEVDDQAQEALKHFDEAQELIGL